MSITSRLSREAEERLLRLAYNKRIRFLFGAEYTHIHENDFDRFMREEQGVKVEYEYAEVDGSLELAEDRVVTSIEGVPIYDTAPAGITGAGYSTYDEHWGELGRCIAEVPQGEYRCTDAGIFRTDDGSPLPVNDIAQARLEQLAAKAGGLIRTGLIAETGGDDDPHTRFYWVVEEAVK